MSITKWQPSPPLSKSSMLSAAQWALNIPLDEAYDALRNLIDSGGFPAEVVKVVNQELHGTSTEYTAGVTKGVVLMATLMQWIPTPPDLTPKPGFGRWVDGVGFVQPVEVTT